MCCLRCVTVPWAALVVATLTPLASAAIEVGDIVAVKKDKDMSELRRGYTVVAVVRAGQELTVRKIDGEWIGTAVEVNGKLVGGWIQQQAVELVRKAAELPVKPTPEKPIPEKPKTEKPKAAADLPALIGQLDDKEPVQLKAIDALTALGPAADAAVPKLAELLAAKADAVRWRSARALAAIGPKAADAVPSLGKALADGNPLVRAQAAHALGQIGPPSKTVVAELGKLVTDPDVRVRRAAVTAWRSIRPGPEVSLPILIKVLEDAEPQIKVQALMAISEAGRAAVPALVEALKNEKARYWACLVLQKIGPDAKEAAPALLPLLKVDAPQDRMQAAMALGEIGASDAESVAAIVLLLKDPENSVRYAAAYALTKIGPAGKDASDALKGHLADADSFLAVTSAWALARVNDKDAEMLDTAVARLIAGLKDKNQRTRVLAAKALVDLKPAPEKTGPALAEALEDADHEVVVNVIEALATQGEAVVPRAIGALKNEKLRLPAIVLLEKLGPKAKEAVPALVTLVKEDKREEVRHAVIDALEAIGAASEEAVPGLIALLADENLEVQRGATFALGKIGPAAKAALPDIRKNFDGNKDLRPVSMWAMVHITPEDDKLAEEAIPFLIAALKRDEGFVRFEAAATLGLIGPRAKAAVPALEAVRDDPDRHVRQAVAEALIKIKG